MRRCPQAPVGSVGVGSTFDEHGRPEPPLVAESQLRAVVQSEHEVEVRRLRLGRPHGRELPGHAEVDAEDGVVAGRAAGVGGVEIDQDPLPAAA